MKRFLLIMTASVLLSCVAGCGGGTSGTVTGEEAETMINEMLKDANEIISEIPGDEIVLPEMPEDEAVDSKPDYLAFVGDYNDSYSQRAYAQVTENEDQESAHVVVDWSNSAFSFCRWEMNVTYDGERLVYSDCTEKEISTDENGNVTEEIIFENGEGYFEWDDEGIMRWTGASEEECRDCEFVR